MGIGGNPPSDPLLLGGVWCRHSNLTWVVGLVDFSYLPKTWDLILSYNTLGAYNLVGDNNTGTQISKSISFSVLNEML